MVNLVKMYEIIAKMGPDALCKEEAMVCTKYKTIKKKVKPSTGPLPVNSEEKRTEVLGDLTLRKSMNIGVGFLLPKEEERFQEMLEQHGKAFAFTSGDRMC